MPVAIFDMDGVLYRGSTVLPDAKETLERLRHAGWQVFFATNNSTATRAEYVERLGRLGLGGDAEHIVTSAYATAHYLERLDPKPRDVYVIGDSTDYDMVAAHRVGARGVLILTGLTDEGAVERARGEAVPDRVIGSLRELFALPELAGT